MRTVEQLLYHEAHLLDSGRFLDWLALMAPDLRYWAPARANLPRNREGEGGSNQLLLFDETKASLRLRISRLDTGLAWVDIPPTRTRRFISNVAAESEADDLVSVRSNFMLFRSRSYREEWLVVGCREDKWSRSEEWHLRERKIIFDHCTLENLSFFL
jgi:3-phenylpropionate/cinnamic acid dioxygenase small subunit